VDVVIERFGVYLGSFDPTVGVEMGKTRPCLIVSPDVMHRAVRTVIVAPMTSTRKRYPYRVNCVFQGHEGQIALDQLRSFDRVRLMRKLGQLDAQTAQLVMNKLLALFGE
jgi:mRNA interferase MazF